VGRKPFVAAEPWWQLEQRFQGWCFLSQPEQRAFELEQQHWLPLRSIYIFWSEVYDLRGHDPVPVT